jgi:hypothetical protein
MIDWSDLRSRGKQFNDAALERIAEAWPRRSPSRTWPLLGVLAIGLMAGAAIGAYAVSRMNRLSEYPDHMGGEPAEADGDEDVEPVAVTTHRTNHRRKGITER